ncbi:MAG: UDP-4-amino-4,6-dideoxy-N-acetyl-beta-L-altrosamine transaminase [Candidatus Gastranaerophilaceae bacterium]|jgi:UDP-4-amino-4,6-dideoxy-N-acetyl-beta-L-altrosamine transaminase
MKKYTYGKQSICLNDIWEVVKTLKSPYLTQGPKVKEFEDNICKYTGAKYAVALSNGTAALHIAMLALGVSKSDEVITSPITFLASSNCVLYVGGTVKFADIDSKTACINPEEIKKQLSSNTKGIIPVHFSGQSCDMEEIHKIAKENNLFIVEDAAHAIGSEYKGSKVGSCKYSDMTIFSFHPVKTVTTGEGGAITTNNKDLYEKLLMLRSHGTTKNPEILTKNDGPWYYEMHMLGYNYRITDLQAALGISQLKQLDKFMAKRRELVSYYKELFSKDERFSLLEEKVYSNACFHLCPILINFENVKMSKGEIFNKMSEKGLNLQVHYIPVHIQPYYKNIGFNEGDFPVAEEYYKKTLSLPLYTELNCSDIKNIVKIIKETVK